MAGGVHIGDTAVHHFHAGTQQIVDGAIDVAFVARNGMAGG